MGNRRSIFLYPLSVIWRIVTDFRNFLYDKKILKSYKFDIPVICVGNITVGGTGKTPHSEYLAGLLSDRYNIVLLSRGYKRKTKGFLFAGSESVSSETGDEPLQISRKFPGISVALCNDRVEGIRRIFTEKPDTDIIILDDGYQHRRISPGLSILLSDFYRPMFRDHLLPYGNLRESIGNIKRADIILITKTPDDPDQVDKMLSEAAKHLSPEQKLFFTSFIYKNPVAVFDKNVSAPTSINDPENRILLVTGIANPLPLYDHLSKKYKEVVHLSFGDHHNFTAKDIDKIYDLWDQPGRVRKYIFTTEKDAVKLKEFTGIAEPLLSAFYYIPIEICFLHDKKTVFDNLIIDYAGKNKRNN